MPENITLIGSLSGAIAGLVTAVVHLYRKNEKLRDNNEENLKTHNKEVRGLLEKTLVSFNEIEKMILTGDNESRMTLKEVIRDAQDKIIDAIEKLNNGDSR